jgi:hypothetical protein
MPILLAFYALITQVMMMNLLIAMFSNTFAMVQENTNVVWKMQRYHLIKEFYTKPALVPPLVIFFHIFLLVRCLFQHCNFCQKSFHQFGFRVKYAKKNEREEKDLIDWERVNAMEHLREADTAKRGTLESHVIATSERVKLMMSKVDDLTERGMTTLSGTVSTTTSKESLKVHPMLESRLTNIEDQVRRTFELVESLTKLMKEINSRPPVATLTTIASSSSADAPDVESRQARKERRREAKRRKTELTMPRMLHTECRNNKYPTSKPGEDFRRFPVPDKFVQFDVEFADYRPVEFTDPSVLSGSDIDIDLSSATSSEALPFNEVDTEHGVLRKSCVKPYRVVRGIPENPIGRTGVTGRGMLRRWGPNHIGLPLVTRWKKTATGNSNVLEVVATKKSDNMWAIPEVVFPTTERSMYLCLEKVLRADVSEETRKCFQRLYARGNRFYRGYFDDPRNTDNAWLEVIAFNFHDENGSMTGSAALQTGDAAGPLSWQPLTSLHVFYAPHHPVLTELAERYQITF